MWNLYVSSPEPRGIPEFQGVFFSSELHLSCGENSCRRSLNQGSPQQLCGMRRNRASNIFHSRVVSVFLFSILGVFRYIRTAELQGGAPPWCSPRSPLPSEPFPRLTSGVRSARCKATAASFCPGCIQSLRRQNKDTLDFCPTNIHCLLFTSPEANMTDKFDPVLSVSVWAKFCLSLTQWMWHFCTSIACFI